MANWLSYNNFRSGDLAAATGGLQADLIASIIDVCRNECDQGRFYVRVLVGNRGTLDVEVPIDLELQGLKADGSVVLLGYHTINDPIPSGKQLESIEFVIEDPAVGDYIELTALVDPTNDSIEGAVLECEEANNRGIWGDNICD